ncbi:MAG: DUF1772 domain-containing protein [Amylibacter sp.]|nr:DUF1772 domain-containing protein [Amylibacter sp.]
MATPTLFLICATTAIGCGLVSGVFLTFSDFLMRSLKQSKTSAGIEVMQIINVEVWKSVFMFLLWGFVALLAGLGTYAYVTLTGPAQPYILTGSISYIIGVLGISYLFNIPMNDKLATLDFTSNQAAEYWRNTYLPRWTFWNYIRAIASGFTATCFLLASIQLA